MTGKLKLVSLVAAKLTAVLLRGCSGHRALRGSRQAALQMFKVLKQLFASHQKVWSR